MKKVDCLKNVGVNAVADNAGEKKKILDGCKFCMEKRGCKCDKAEELFDQPSILSPHSPDNWVKYSAFVSEKPFDFPLKCYEYGPAFLRYCEDCQIVYKKRWCFTDDGTLEDLYCGTFGDICPHCGKLGTPVSDLYQAAYDPYLEKDYYYTGFYPPCPYERGLGCTNAHTENCGKDCFYHPFHIHSSETEEEYDVLAEDCDLLGYEEKEWLEGPELEYLYRKHLFAKKTMSTRDIMVALDLVESIFCGNQHPINEENYQRDVEFFRTYEADDAYRLTPCYGNCDSMCELCPIDGREKEYVFKNIEERLNYAKESLQYKKEQLFSLYAELLDISLILNQTVNGDFNKVVSLIRKICIRMDEKDADNLVALVVSLFETAKALARVDTSYMRAKDYTEVNTI